MAHDIIMPALGMAQDTGIIVSWKKNLGDEVRAGDILMEIETDKTTVEVEAGHDGFLAQVMAETGVPIPVGQVVAVISRDRNDVGAPVQARPAPDVKPPETPPPAPTVTPLPAPAAPEPRPADAPPSSGGRVLASPKARREAEARGIDLGRLVRLGVPEPIHVADLARAGAATAGPSASLMRVTIDRAPFEKFLAWIDSDAAVAIDATSVWAAFSAGSLRRALGFANGQPVAVHATRFPDETLVGFTDPDLSGLRGLESGPASETAALTLLDVTATPLSAYRQAGDRSLPYLTVANGPAPAYIDLVLEFDPTALPPAAALEFLRDLAERAHNPLRHLL